MRIDNTRGNDDADYQAKVRQSVMAALKKPAKGTYYASVVKKQEDGEEG